MIPYGRVGAVVVPERRRRGRGSARRRRSRPGRGAAGRARGRRRRSARAGPRPTSPSRPSRIAAHGTSTSSGHGCTILTPKPPPTSGVMHLDLVAAAGRAWRRGRPARWSRSGSRSAPAATGRRRPSGRARPCPPAASTATALDVEVELEHVRGAASIAAGASPTSCTRCAATLPGTSSCTRRVAAPALLDADDRRQRPRTSTRIRSSGVLGDVAVGRDDHRRRLADVVHHVRGQRVAGAAVGAAPGAGSAAAAARRPGPSARRPAGPRRCRSATSPSTSSASVDVDVEDPGVRVRAAHERRRQRAVAEVVEVAPVAAQQPGVLAALHPAAEQRGRRDRLLLDRLLDGGHGRASRASSAARSTDGHDVLVAGAPAQVAGDRLAGLVLGRVGVVPQVGATVVRKPGVQKPHCRPWHSLNACCTGCRLAVGGPRSPSTVVTSAPSTVTANSRHERTGTPSSSTVQAPQTPCSQPTWVPVSPRSWRSASDSSRRAGTVDAVLGAVDDQAHGQRLLAHAALPPACLDPAQACASARAVSTRGEVPPVVGAWRGCRPRGRGARRRARPPPRQLCGSSPGPPAPRRTGRRRRGSAPSRCTGRAARERRRRRRRRRRRTSRSRRAGARPRAKAVPAPRRSAGKKASTASSPGRPPTPAGRRRSRPRRPRAGPGPMRASRCRRGRPARRASRRPGRRARADRRWSRGCGWSGARRAAGAWRSNGCTAAAPSRPLDLRVPGKGPDTDAVRVGACT